MSGLPLEGDTIVALLGIVMALVLVSRSGAMQRLTSRQRLAYALIWAVLIGVLAAIADRVGR